VGLVIAGIVIVVAAAVALVAVRQRRSATEPGPIEQEPAHDEPTPMTGLESALDQATDSSGRPLRDRLDDEEVDDLRVPDDTGPLLRRALDQVVQDPDRPDPVADTPAAGDQNDAGDEG
jgi:hypothetical protein